MGNPTPVVKACWLCGGAVALARLERCEGEDAGVRVAIDGLPAQACQNGHRRFLTPEFPRHLLEEVLRTNGLFSAPPAVKKGLLLRRYHCPQCGAALGRGAPADAARQVALEQSAPFSVAVQVTLYRCPQCSREASPPWEEFEGHVMKAAARAFRAANIPPG